MTTQTVHFDRELRRLDPEDAAAWRAWLTQHQLNGLDIACLASWSTRSRLSGSWPA